MFLPLANLATAHDNSYNKASDYMHYDMRLTFAVKKKYG